MKTFKDESFDNWMHKDNELIWCIHQERMDNLHYHEKCVPVVTDVEERRKKHADNQA